MNTNRTRYATAPTYGMLKRGAGKRQQPLQQPTAPDFTQLPPQEQQPFGQPQTVNPQAGFPVGAPYAQPAAPFMPSAGQSLLGSQVAPVAPPFPFAPGQYPQQAASNQPNFAAVPIPQLAQPQAAPQQPQQGFSVRQQGYVPQAMPLATNTVIPASLLNAPPMQPPIPPQQGFAAPYTQGASFTPPPPDQGSLSGLQPSGVPQPPTAPPKPPRKPLGKDGWTKIFLFGFLPILFVVCIMPGTPEFLKYAFMILTILSMGAMWYLQLFSPSTRSTVTIVAVALCVILVILLVSSVDRTRPAAAVDKPPEIESTAQPESTVAPVAAPEQSVIREEVASESAAGLRLAEFMDYWKAGLVQSMVQLVQPSWATPLEKPEYDLFIILGNRTPVDYEIISITGADVDSSRTITMDATIDKNNNSTPEKYRFLILMVKVSDVWYVDPNSLTSNDLQATTPAVSIREATLNVDSPRTTTTPVPDPSTRLYYNQKGGGSYYHLNPECPAVNAKWFPLDSFLYSELSEDPYKKLLPCLKCGAPLEPHE